MQHYPAVALSLHPTRHRSTLRPRPRQFNLSTTCRHRHITMEHPNLSTISYRSCTARPLCHTRHYCASTNHHVTPLITSNSASTSSAPSIDNSFSIPLAASCLVPLGFVLVFHFLIFFISSSNKLSDVH